MQQIQWDLEVLRITKITPNQEDSNRVATGPLRILLGKLSGEEWGADYYSDGRLLQGTSVGSALKQAWEKMGCRAISNLLVCLPQSVVSWEVVGVGEKGRR